jgi:hypothetical protein
MTTFYRINTFASTYGSSTYDNGNYNGTNLTSTGTRITTDGTGSTLTNTGVLVGLIVGVAAATLLIAMIVRIWRRPKQATVPVTDDDESAHSAVSSDQ